MKRVIVVAISVLLALSMTAPIVLAQIPPTSTPDPAIPYGSSGYKYMHSFNETAGQGFEAPNFDDSQWLTGDAAFGDPLPPNLNEGCPLTNDSSIKTHWPLGDPDQPSYILVRKDFDLPSDAKNVKVSVAIDNDVQVFVNGKDISGGVKTHDGCAEQDSLIFTAPDDTLNKGASNILAVRGIDRGVVSYLDLKVTYETVDTSITSGPKEGSTVTTKSATFEFAADPPEDATFECKLDSGGWEGCTSPKTYDNLSDGRHTFQVRATGPRGTDFSPAVRTWTVDTTGPDTQITSSNPPIEANGRTYTNSTSAAFGFRFRGIFETGISYKCSLDNSAWSACGGGFSGSKTYTGLAEREHSFQVAAVDRWGNLDPYPESRTWTVDTTPPEVSSTSPSNNATGVTTTSTISAAFKKGGASVDRNTLTTNTFKVEQVKATGNVPVSGTIVFDEDSQTVTFTPSSSLAKGAYRVTITTGVKDKAGNALAKDYTWQFATAGPSK